MTAPHHRMALSLLLRLGGLVLAIGFVVFAAAGWISVHHAALAETALAQAPEQRREVLRTALKFNPALGEAWLGLGRLELSQGHREPARAAMARAVQTHPLYEAHHELASVLFTQTIGAEDPVIRYEALQALDTALAIFPGDTELINQAVRVALWNRDPERARRYLDLGDRFKIDPDDPRAQNLDTLLLRAELAQVDGDTRLQRRLCGLALKLEPKSDDALAALATLLTGEDGDLVLADALSPSAGRGPITLAHIDTLVQMCVDQGNFDRLLNLFDHLVANRPPRAEILTQFDLLLATALSHLADIAIAERDSERGMQVIEAYGRARGTVGRLSDADLAKFRAIVSQMAREAGADRSGRGVVQFLRRLHEVRRRHGSSDTTAGTLCTQFTQSLSQTFSEGNLSEQSELFLGALLDLHAESDGTDSFLEGQISVFTQGHIGIALRYGRPDVAIGALVQLRDHRRRLARPAPAIERLYVAYTTIVARWFRDAQDAEAAQVLLQAISGEEPEDNTGELAGILQALREMN